MTACRTVSPQVVSLRGVLFHLPRCGRAALQAIDLDIEAEPVRRAQWAPARRARRRWRSVSTAASRSSNPAASAARSAMLDQCARGGDRVRSRRHGRLGLAGLRGAALRHQRAPEVAFGLEQLGVPRDEMRRRIATALEFVGLASWSPAIQACCPGGEAAVGDRGTARPRAGAARLRLNRRPISIRSARRRYSTVLAALRGRGGTTLLIEHETEAAQRADRLLLMEEGRDRRRRRARASCCATSSGSNGWACGRSTSTTSRDRLGWPEHVASVEQALAHCSSASTGQERGD